MMEFKPEREQGCPWVSMCDCSECEMPCAYFAQRDKKRRIKRAHVIAMLLHGAGAIIGIALIAMAIGWLWMETHMPARVHFRSEYHGGNSVQ